MKQPFFSIVMPAYNAENSIVETIKSVINQNWTDYELIIVNDGSTDNTEKLVSNYTRSDERIKMLTIENGGPGNARNIGIAKANGQYLILIDSDDGLPEHSLATYAHELNETNYDLIVSSYEFNVMDNGKVVKKRIVKAENQVFDSNDEFLNQLYPLMSQQLMYVIWNKVYRLDIIKKHQINFPPYSSCEDRLFNIRYYQHVNIVKVMSDILYKYSFEGKNSLTNKFLTNKFETFVAFYVELKDLTLNNLEGTSALFLKGVMSCVIPIHSSDCPFSFKEKLRYINKILNHEEVRNAVSISSQDTMMRKIMTFLFYSKNKYLIWLTSKIMYIVSNSSPKMIEKLKENF